MWVSNRVWMNQEIHLVKTIEAYVFTITKKYIARFDFIIKHISTQDYVFQPQLTYLTYGIVLHQQPIVHNILNQSPCKSFHTRSEKTLLDVTSGEQNNKLKAIMELK